MKNALLYFLVLLFVSCSSEKKETPVAQEISDSQNQPSEAPIAVPIADTPTETNSKQTPEQFLGLRTDSTVRRQIDEISKSFSKVPYLFSYRDEPYFIVYNGTWEDDEAQRFEQEGRYGIVNSLNRMELEVAYDKIYNPEVTFRRCVEVKEGGKVGLYHFDRSRLLTPQFDFIVPQHGTDSLAYGSKNGDWYSIAYDGDFHIKRTSFSFAQYLKDFPLQTENFHETPLQNIMFEIHDEWQWEGGGVIIIPSYLEQLGAFASVYEHHILPGESAEGGLGEISLAVVEEKDLSGKVTSFVLDVYEEYFYVRGEASDQKSLATFNEQNHAFSYTKLNQKNKEYFCQEENIRFISDTLLEVQSTSELGERYRWESEFSYYAILPSGRIELLQSDRHFDQSKFSFLDDRHFKGCFGKSISSEERLLLTEEEQDFSVWKTEHLSIEDLDIMRNEIFADYGYQFNSAKWQDYFGQFDWYQPRFDNVDDQLTERDKANIKTILALKEKMLDNEIEYTKIHEVGYSAPG